MKKRPNTKTKWRRKDLIRKQNEEKTWYENKMKKKRPNTKTKWRRKEIRKQNEEEKT